MATYDVLARAVALVGAAAIRWRRSQGGARTAAVGSAPEIPPARPQGSLPTLKMPTARGWAPGHLPTAAPGLRVQAFAAGLKHPRWIHVLPNGDVTVAEALQSSGQPRTLFDHAMVATMRRAAAIGTSPNRITLLRDADGDGVAELKTVFLDHLHSPFGMALVGDQLYVANSDAILAFPYRSGQTRIAAAGRLVTTLPAGTINHHWTKNIIASPDGRRLYATVGSNSNVAENGLAAEEGRAMVWEVDLPSGNKRPYATGLRNPNGLAWEPHTGALWTVVNERDELGNDLVPDYLSSLKPGGFYGWPYSWFGPHVDTRVTPPRPDKVAQALAPDYALGAHVAALGLAAAARTALPAPFAEGMFIGLHGSWNRKPPVGYKVVFVPFRAGRPAGPPLDVLTGFVNERGEARGRPVGVALDGRGALLVADDVGNTVWRATAAQAR